MDQQNGLAPGEYAPAHPESAEGLRQLAWEYADQGRWAEAMETYRRAIELDPSNADLHNDLGTVYEEIGKPDEAERAYRRALALDPKNSMAYYNLGALYEEQQRASEAIEAFEQCLKVSADPDERSDATSRLTSMLPEGTVVTQMYRRLRGETTTLLVLGGLSVVARGTLDPAWGVVMIALAVLCWRVRIPAIFALLSVFMAWAAAVNCLAVFMGGRAFWLALGLLQVYWAVSLLKEFRTYRSLPLQELFEAGAWPADLPPPQQESAVTRRFAIASAILAGTAVMLVSGLLVGSLVTISRPDPPVWLEWLVAGVVDMAALALALAVAAALSENDGKGWAFGAIAASGLLLAGWLVFLIWPV